MEYPISVEEESHKSTFQYNPGAIVCVELNFIFYISHVYQNISLFLLHPVRNLLARITIHKNLKFRAQLRNVIVG